jgi:hypothetical protein
MPRTPQLSHELLELALAGLESKRDRLEEQIREVQSLLGRRATPQSRTPRAAAARPRKRRMSAAGRKRIAEATRKRWAEWRKGNNQGPLRQDASHYSQRDKDVMDI